MTAQLIYDLVPLGSIIRYSDGTPRPPERFAKKLSAWENANGGGRLIRKTPARQTAQYSSPAQFTLHEGDYGSGGVTVLRVHKSFSVDCGLKFIVTSRPAPGSVRVFDRAGEGAELVYLAASRQDAEVWLQSHGYPNAVLEDVSADTVAADAVEGRAA